MKLNTFLEDTKKFWESRGIRPISFYTLQGFTNWQVEIPPEHPDLKNPEFIALQAQEILYVLPTIVAERFTPPVFTLKVGKLFADITDRTGKKGIPFSRSRPVLAEMCTQPGAAELPNIVKLTRNKRILNVIIKAQRQGTENILFFPLANFCETISIESALRVLKHFEKGESHGRVDGSP